MIDPERLEALLIVDLERTMSGRGFVTVDGFSLTDRQRELVSSATGADIMAAADVLESQAAEIRLRADREEQLGRLLLPYMAGPPERTAEEAVGVMPTAEARRARELAQELGWLLSSA